MCLGVLVDVILSELKDRLDQLNCWLNNKDTKRMDNVECHRPSTDSNGSVQFTLMKLNNVEDVRTMLSIFGQYNTKGPIELDVSMVGSFEHI